MSKILCFSVDDPVKRAKILIISGTHGNPEGESGLSKIRCLHQDFYFEDCASVGVQHGREIKPGEFFEGSPDVSRPLKDEKFKDEHLKIFDIKNPAQKLKKMRPDCYYSDPELQPVLELVLSPLTRHLIISVS